MFTGIALQHRLFVRCGIGGGYNFIRLNNSSFLNTCRLIVQN